MQIGFTPDQKSDSIFDLELFRLDKDHKARVLLIEQNIEVEFRHYVDEFGYVFCHGDYNTLLTSGSDTKCKFCQAAENSKVIKPARRSFICLIVVYRTNKQGTLISPVGFEIIPWIFGDDKFNDLVTKKEQWGDLRQHDLLIECTGKQYQRFRMDVLPEAFWLKDPTLKDQVVAEYKNLRQKYANDLRRLMGRDVTKIEDIDKIINDAIGAAPVPEYATNTDINNILSGQPAPQPVAQTPVNAPVVKDAGIDFSSLLDGVPNTNQPVEQKGNELTQPAPQPVQQQTNTPVQQPVLEKKTDNKQPVNTTNNNTNPVDAVQVDGVNFDDLLNT